MSRLRRTRTPARWTPRTAGALARRTVQAMAAPPRLHPAALAGLDEPVRRYFAHALGARAPPARATLRMTGRSGVGVWLCFTAVWEGAARSFTWTAASGPG